jgi:ribosomal protein S27E
VATSQRTYESACPGCGAAVAFRSAASTHAVCGYCQSTVVRKGDALEALGKTADIFDDYSPLQLYAQGEQNGKAFTLLGRLQFESPAGRWMEWQAQFDDGRRLVLSEDNGSFVWLAPVMDVSQLPAAERMLLGNTYALLGNFYTATAVQSISLIAAQGELTQPPPQGKPFLAAELRSSDGKLLSICYHSELPSMYLGKAVELDSLKLTGLKQGSTANIKGRQFNCPNCASPVTVQLESSKSMTCPACDSLIDLSQGIGGQLSHALQHEPIRPQIALGTVGTLAGKSWQVVGYQHRVGSVASADDDEGEDEESFGWEEYLLYNAKAGFQFLVDATDGWSLYKTTTGAAKQSFNNNTASYLGTMYRQDYSYTANTDFVAGEFYWPLRRDYRTFNTDYSAGKSLLNREQVGQEITWSVGSRLEHETVMLAFGLGANESFKFERDAHVNAFPWKPMIILLIAALAFVFIMLLVRTTRNNVSCDKDYNAASEVSMEQQREQCERSKRSLRTGTGSSGGSYGGYSSGGGGHK